MSELLKDNYFFTIFYKVSKKLNTELTNIISPIDNDTVASIVKYSFKNLSDFILFGTLSSNIK